LIARAVLAEERTQEEERERERERESARAISDFDFVGRTGVAARNENCEMRELIRSRFDHAPRLIDAATRLIRLALRLGFYRLSLLGVDTA
jgi:hypothetical protein